MDLIGQKLFKIFLMFVVSVPLRAVTVSPALCPTNKIAPHRHVKRWDYQPRTLGAFYDLLAPGPGINQGYDPNLQEDPQKDDPDDCGDIEDYDEHDLSSITPKYPYRYGNGYGDGRRFFGLFNGGNPQGENPQNEHRPPYRPQQPPYPQQQPQYPPQRPPRPPYASGGYFENNPYRPPIQHSPSDDIKPVHDGVHEPQTTYRPDVIGGPISHVVGVAAFPARPQYRPPRPTYRPPERATRAPEPHHTTQTPYTRYPQRPQVAQMSYTTRRPRPRQLNQDSSIFGSFLDLLF